ncbi:MAG: RluA family pseudouridine synthase [bacterium]
MNDGWTYRERLGGRAVGRRLDDYLAGTWAHTTLAEWREHIVNGRVLLDGERVGIDAVLVRGQAVHWLRPPWEEPAAPLLLTVLYDDGDVIVVAKPAGLPTLPGGGFLQHTLLHQLRLLDTTASPAHRLGRWTSGAVLCSRGSAHGANLAGQFAARSIHKRYRALASGLPEHDRFDVRTPIGPVPYLPLGTVHAANPDGRRSESTVTVIERRGDSFLCDVAIATGRPHQIRIHLAAAGHPLVGDPLYVVGGHPTPGGSAVPGDPGYHLHSASIGFQHPRTGRRVVVAAPPPEILEVAASSSC